MLFYVFTVCFVNVIKVAESEPET